MADGLVCYEGQLEIPLQLHTLVAFRRWALSEGFPTQGRIDYLAGRIEVEMSPEDLFTHGVLKTELVSVLSQLARQLDLGYVFSDSTRVSCPAAELSVEPDVVLLTRAALDEGRARLVPKSAQDDRFVELEGAPDLVVEIVSDASARKDTQRLPVAYHRAGVREFWLLDARGEQLEFAIWHWAAGGYERSPIDADGCQSSVVLGRCFRLTREADARGLWRYDLQPS
ncbi:MAG: Uma2 family endonuclease [Pirellulaceae bacterium]|nr:Uma2 family endonuclease [Pirellulaceae bacterium]